MTERELRRLLRWWQQRLNLPEWRISLRLVYEDELNDPGAVAETKIVDRALEAEIRIQRLDDLQRHYGEDALSDRAADLELSHVHELVHLRLEPVRYEFRSGSWARRALEQSIESAAVALVALRRHGSRAIALAPKGGDRGLADA